MRTETETTLTYNIRSYTFNRENYFNTLHRLNAIQGPCSISFSIPFPSFFSCALFSFNFSRIFCIVPGRLLTAWGWIFSMTIIICLWTTEKVFFFYGKKSPWTGIASFFFLSYINVAMRVCLLWKITEVTRAVDVDGGINLWSEVVFFCCQKTFRFSNLIARGSFSLFC